MKKPFLTLLTFYGSYLWFSSFSKSVLPTHFWAQGLSLQQQILGTLLLFCGQTLVILTLRRLTAHLSWKLALFSILTYIILSIKIVSVFQFYIASFINGFSIFFFFIFYNVAHFEKTPREKTGGSSAIMFSVVPLVNIAAPLLAGYIAQTHLAWLWIFSGIFFLETFYLIGFQENFSLSYSLSAAVNEIKATRVFIFLEGIWEAMLFGIIPIYSLFFIKTPLFYGSFLAYLSLVAAGANLLLGKLTDRMQKRAVFLYPLTLIMAGVTFLFPLVTQSLLLWIIATGILQFLVPLFWNISTAMVVDAHRNLRLAIPGRELMLALGRVVGLSLTYLSFTYEASPRAIFWILGGIFLLYPLTLYWNTQKKHYTYL